MMNTCSRSTLFKITLIEGLDNLPVQSRLMKTTTVTPTSAENYKTKTQSSFKKLVRVNSKNHKTFQVYFERAPDIFYNLLLLDPQTILRLRLAKIFSQQRSLS